MGNIIRWPGVVVASKAITIGLLSSIPLVLVYLYTGGHWGARALMIIAAAVAGSLLRVVGIRPEEGWRPMVLLLGAVGILILIMSAFP